MSDASDDSARAAFERAFVATRFMLGATSDPLKGLLVHTREARRLGFALSQVGREDRALVLAAEWGKFVLALKRRGFSQERSP